MQGEYLISGNHKKIKNLPGDRLERRTRFEDRDRGWQGAFVPGDETFRFRVQGYRTPAGFARFFRFFRFLVFRIVEVGV